MKTYQFTALLILIITFFACSNDDDNQNGQVSLKSYEANDTTYFITYDDSGKIASFELPGQGSKLLNILRYDMGGNLTTVESNVFSDATLTYNDQGQVIGMDDGTSNGVSNFTYNEAGELTRQRAEYDTGNGSVRDFTYLNGRISSFIEVRIASTAGGPVHVYRYTFTYDGIGNITRIVVAQSPVEVENFENIRIHNFTYDNHKNPFGEIILNQIGLSEIFFAPVENFYLFATYEFPLLSAYPIYITSQNNILTETITEVGSGEVSTKSYMYTYNSQQYPTRIEFTETDSSGSVVFTDTTTLNY